MSTTALLDPAPAPHATLRRRIAPLCHLVRVAAVLWVLWNLVNIINNLENLRRVLKVDWRSLDAQFAAVLVVSLTTLLFIIATGYCVWRLFGTYLQGRIFTVVAAVWMQRAGVTGLVGSLVVVVWRRLQLVTLTGQMHLPVSDLLFGLGPPVFPADLLRTLFCLYVIALGQIFKTAAEIADDHARIV
jgi:hypothetical protein